MFNIKKFLSGRFIYKKDNFSQMKKWCILSLVLFLSLAFMISNASAVFIGITDGYVKNYTGGAVYQAAVTVTVSQCSGGQSNGCIGNTLTDANGYYLVSNLNLPKYGGVSVTATEGAGSATQTDTADGYQIAHVNLTLCYPPTSPSITNVADSHNTTATFVWTSGTDPYGRATHDVFVLDSSTTDPASSPITRTGLSVSSHSWSVKTCNSGCCSSASSDTFSVTNTNPTKPTNTQFTNYADNITSLSWDSGIDSDGDPTYDEFRYSNGSIISPATSPFNVTSEDLISWEVRTCDNLGGCSSWTSVDSVTCTTNVTTPVTCPTCPDYSGCGGGGIILPPGFYKGKKKGFPERARVELVCNGIPISNETLLRININFRKGSRKLSVYGINYSLENLEYCPWCYDGVKNYDETGIDCGGSCRECGVVEAFTPVQEIRGIIERFINSLIDKVRKLLFLD